MASFKDTFEAKHFAANSFASGLFRGSSVGSAAITGQWADVVSCIISQPRLDSRSDNPRIITHSNQYRHDSYSDQFRVTTEAD